MYALFGSGVTWYMQTIQASSQCLSAHVHCDELQRAVHYLDNDALQAASRRLQEQYLGTGAIGEKKLLRGPLGLLAVLIPITFQQQTSAGYMNASTCCGHLILNTVLVLCCLQKPTVSLQLFFCKTACGNFHTLAPGERDMPGLV